MSALKLAQPPQGASGASVAEFVPPPPESRDRAIADAIIQAVRALNQALDDAVKAGLMVEPTFATASRRFDDMGITAQSYVANVKVFRKLC
jgi:hypothetical protein